MFHQILTLAICSRWIEPCPARFLQRRLANWNFFPGAAFWRNVIFLKAEAEHLGSGAQIRRQKKNSGEAARRPTIFFRGAMPSGVGGGWCVVVRLRALWINHSIKVLSVAQRFTQILPYHNGPFFIDLRPITFSYLQCPYLLAALVFSNIANNISQTSFKFACTIFKI